MEAAVYLRLLDTLLRYITTGSCKLYWRQLTVGKGAAKLNVLWFAATAVYSTFTRHLPLLPPFPGSSHLVTVHCTCPNCSCLRKRIHQGKAGECSTRYDSRWVKTDTEMFSFWFQQEDIGDVMSTVLLSAALKTNDEAGRRRWAIYKLNMYSLHTLATHFCTFP